MIEGVDVSHHQGSIDWPAVAGAGIRFAWIKATEGASFVDRRFAGNREAAKAAGLVVGAYHFARPGGPPRANAQHFFDVVGDTAGELAPVLDLEVDGGLSPQELAGWVRLFLSHADELFGRPCAVYCSPGWWNGNVAASIGNLDDHPLWVAHWHTERPELPRSWSSWAAHQYTSDGRVPGVHGRCDRNRAPTLAPLLHDQEVIVMPDGTEIIVPVGSSVAGIAGTPSGNGYWLVTTAGEVVTFGDAEYFGRAEAPFDPDPAD